VQLDAEFPEYISHGVSWCEPYPNFVVYIVSIVGIHLSSPYAHFVFLFRIECYYVGIKITIIRSVYNECFKYFILCVRHQAVVAEWAKRKACLQVRQDARDAQVVQLLDLQ